MNLAFRMRPQNLSEFVGQEHLVGTGRIIRRMIESDQLSSMLFWGPPGSGKTTLAYIISKETNSDFHTLSGVSTGKADLLRIIEIAKENQQVRHPRPSVIPANAGIMDPHLHEDGNKKAENDNSKETRTAKQKRTILFIDEIHRWNKAQQDALLPHVESGLIILIGATTENPSFEVISALLSRCRVFVLKSLTRDDLKKIVESALKYKEKGLGTYKKTISDDALELLTRLSGGDSRIMLNALEMAVVHYSSSEQSESRSSRPASRPASTAKRGEQGGQARTITPEIIQEVFQTKSAGLYDKNADEHYNIISAFIKSMRGSDVDAALYYLARMLENGEDPKFIARRMIIFASEDIGLADRGALIQANEAFDAVHKIGMPESQLILAHIVVYLARAKKSRATTNALGKAQKAVYDFPNEPVPLHLRNAPTKLMKNLGYAKNYEWSEKYVGPKGTQSFLPEKLKDKKFYEE